MSANRERVYRGGPARATVWQSVGLRDRRERRSHLTAPRVPTVGIDIGGTKVMAGVVDADGTILETLRTETPDKSKSPKVVEDTIADLVLDLSERHDVHAVGIGAAGWVDADRSRVLFAPHLAWRDAEARDVLYLGRGTSFPVALEGALKLKEISYIHAEGYAAGEMKHGPIALIDELVPVVVVAPSDNLFDKTASNFEQVKARGGKLVLISDAAGVARLGGQATASIILPAINPVVAPILYTIPVQMLAYYTAVAKGTDVDQPRNLAKSVTVE